MLSRVLLFLCSPTLSLSRCPVARSSEETAEGGQVASDRLDEIRDHVEVLYVLVDDLRLLDDLGLSEAELLFDLALLVAEDAALNHDVCAARGQDGHGGVRLDASDHLGSTVDLAVATVKVDDHGPSPALLVRVGRTIDDGHITDLVVEPRPGVEELVDVGLLGHELQLVLERGHDGAENGRHVDLGHGRDDISLVLEQAQLGEL